VAFSDSQPTVSLLASAAFANADLYKFVSLNSSGHVAIGPTTASGAVGTLLSESTAAGNAVTVGLLSGIGKLRLAGSTRAAGQTIAGSSNGFGIAPTTDQAQLGTIVAGSSGSTGRIVSVLFHMNADV